MSSDDDFLQELLAAFQIEADEHLQAMASGLLELEQTPAAEAQMPLLETIYREAHSLKGAARAVNRMDVETVCQSLETVFSAWKRREIVPSPELFDTFHHAIDLVNRLLAVPEVDEAAPDRRRIAEITQRLDRVEDGHGAPPTPPPPLPPPIHEPERPEIADAASPPPGPAERTAASDTVRIATAKLDSLLLQAEEMLVTKLFAVQRAADLRDTQLLLEGWRKEWGRIAPTVRDPGARDLLDRNQTFLKTLEGRLSALLRSAEHDQRVLGLLVDNLLEDTKKLLMLPFSTLLAIFPKMVRDIARDQGKQVELALGGGEVEIDKRILEEMKDPLIHLLRNSVDHGVEPPPERALRHKPPRATVSVSVSQIGGNEVEIRIADDGGGIDVEKVKASAVRHGFVSPETAREMPEAQALLLIFQSDVSTSPIITEISGRGLGMAIVREKVEKLGGRIAIETRLGVGTTFHIHLPLTLATFKGILVEAAGQTFVLPTASVERVVRVRDEEIQTVENTATILQNGRLLSLVRLDDVLELPRREGRGEASAYTPVVILGTADRRIGFRVDSVRGEQEVLVKTLGKPLRRVRNVAGATVLGSGKAVPILNVADLMKSATRVAAALPARAPLPEEDGAAGPPSILIAEDSITSRMLIKNILESAGYPVTTAVDGLDALATLRTGDFALVVSDVDMPRMNGFDLTARIRSDPALSELPVVLVTARESREDRERGVDVGASAYIVKSSFDQSNLLDVIRRLV